VQRRSLPRGEHPIATRDLEAGRKNPLRPAGYWPRGLLACETQEGLGLCDGTYLADRRRVSLPIDGWASILRTAAPPTPLATSRCAGAADAPPGQADFFCARADWIGAQSSMGRLPTPGILIAAASEWLCQHVIKSLLARVAKLREADGHGTVAGFGLGAIGPE